MRRTCLALLLAAMMMAALPVRAEAPGPACRENRPGCLLLQEVLNGAFSRMDPADSLSVRIHAAVLPMLLSLTEEDLSHFLTEYPAEEALLRRSLHAATGYCLWADILSRPGEGDERLNNSRLVLLLFLRPASGSRDVEDRATIRSMMTEELLKEMAQMNGVSPAFLEHLFYSDDWRDVSAPS